MPSAERKSPRAEELIVEIYRQRAELLESGRKPVRVVLSRAQYETIQQYRALLGELPDGRPDYLDRYSVFGMEICVDDVAVPGVQTAEDGKTEK